MTGEPIPLARPDVGPREEELVRDVLRSGRLSLGPMLERFERDFAAWVGSEDAVAVSSGTAALHLAVRALGWSAGDEVVTTPLSFVASANCLLYEQAVPVFCDIDERTLNIDPQAAAAACGPRTAGLLPVHLFGYPADMEALEALAGERGLGVVEDACEALGSVDAAGVRVGASGNPAAFGFYANKQLVTGEGGMLTCGDADGRGHGAQRAQPGPRRRHGLALARPAGLQLPALGRRRGARRRTGRAPRRPARRARPRGAPVPRAAGRASRGWCCPARTRGRSAAAGSCSSCRCPTEADRDGVIGALAAEGIASKAYLPCIHLQPLYRERFGFRGGEFPVAERVAARSLALPFFTAMGEAEVERVASALEAALGQQR